MYASHGGNLHAYVPVIADVINTPDLSTFSAYGIENCYQFHGYTLADVAQVSLPGGIAGQAMSYTSQQFGSWSIVYWIVPVKMGTSTNYERVVLYVQNSGNGTIVPGLTSNGVRNLSGSLEHPGGRRWHSSITGPSWWRLRGDDRVTGQHANHLARVAQSPRDPTFAARS